jgi:glycerophosphoryl diester phosphodiesterase
MFSRMKKNKIYVFGHRGASGYHTENTIKSFRTAANMGAGIETDVRLTKDDVLICFHDPGFKLDSKWQAIKKIEWNELKKIPFPDNRDIPTAADLFKFCKTQFPMVKLSFDIGNTKAGIKLIDLAYDYGFLDQIFITDMFLTRLKKLRNYDNKVNLVHTMDFRLTKITSSNTELKELKELGIEAINIKNNNHIKHNFTSVVDNGFNCFIWGVNTKMRMKKILNLDYKGMKMNAIYTDYPDKFIRIKENYEN